MVGLVSVSVLVVPVSVVWEMGDGRREVCVGPGVRYDVGRPAGVQRTSCSHTYTDHTGSTVVTATVSWRASFVTSNGQSGELGVVTRSSSLRLEVEELVTRLGRG